MQRPYDGYSPLHEAVRHGFFSAAIALIECGADVHARTHANETALEIARQFNYTAIVHYIEHVIKKETEFGTLPGPEESSPALGSPSENERPAAHALIRAIRMGD